MTPPRIHAGLIESLSLEDLSCAGIRETDDGLLITWKSVETRVKVLREAASEQAPAGPSTPLGRHRLVFIEGTLERGAIQRLLVHTREVLSAAKEERSGAPAMPGLIDYCDRAALNPGEEADPCFDVWGAQMSFMFGADIGLYGDRRVKLLHSSMECPMGSNLLSGWYEAGPRPWRRENLLRNNDPALVHISDVDDESVISGGEARLALTAAACRDDARDHGVLLYQGCDYHMIGDDPLAACRRGLDDPEVAVRMVETFAADGDEPEENPWADLLARIPENARDDGPSVSFAGYGPWDAPELKELREILEELGIRVNGALLPSVSEGAPEILRGTDLWLVSPWRPIQRVIGEPLRRSGARSIAPRLPFGAPGLRRWLGEVTAALDLPAPSAEMFNGWIERYARGRDHWTRQVREAGVHAVFAVTRGSLEEFLSPEFFYGAAPDEVLADTGARVTIIPPGTRLDQVLAEDRIDLLYSETAGGAWAKRYGITPFSIADLRFGLGGCLRTSARIRALAGLTLYRRCSARLGGER